MANQTSEQTQSSESVADMIVLDIGKRDKKDIKKLRKGRGKLLNKVGTTVEQLREAGKIDANAQVVLVVVKEKNSDLFGD